MDFMKVFDQTVREIKREVNIKVLKVPEIEQKVLDATSNEAWGPHGSDLAELAKATKRFTDCQLVMNVLWTRLADGGRNWRHVYKALAVIEYLIANGSEKAVDDIIEHTSQISSLSGFEYAEPNGKDVGINVRKKSETIISLLSNKDKIQEVRNKAAANRDKYFGLSSTGVTYKSSSASSSFGSSNFPSKDRYGGFGAKKEGEMFKDSYRDGELQDDDVSKDSREKSRRGFAIEDDEHNMKTSTRYGSRNQDASASNATKTSAKLNNSNDYGTIPSQNTGALDGPEDDFDDFDPRGSSTTGASPAAATVNEVDLFGNFMDEPVVAPMSVQNSNTTADEVDLFVDATFVSAAPHVDAEPNFQTQDTVDLFGSQPTFSSASSATVDFFTAPGPVLQTDMHPPPPQNEGINSHTADPFASVPLNTFDGSDLFGAFTFQTDQVSAEPLYNSTNQGNVNSRNPSSAMEVKPQSKKDAFQVKSGIWADSLSRGIIDLNITAPKRTNLADIGIVGGLIDVAEEKEKVLPSSGFMGRAMGTGSGLGRSGFNPSTGADNGDDVFSTLRHQQGFGNLRK